MKMSLMNLWIVFIIDMSKEHIEKYKNTPCDNQILCKLYQISDVQKVNVYLHSFSRKTKKAELISLQSTNRILDAICQWCVIKIDYIRSYARTGKFSNFVRIPDTVDVHVYTDRHTCTSGLTRKVGITQGSLLKGKSWTETFLLLFWQYFSRRSLPFAIFRGKSW